MSRILSAAAVSAGVGLAAWVITELLTSPLTDRQGLVVWDAMIVAIPLLLAVTLLAPVIAGMIGGLVSASVAAAVGSLAGYLAATLLVVVVLRGDRLLPVSSYLLPSVIFGVLILAGHLTGIAVRPRLRPA